MCQLKGSRTSFRYLLVAIGLAASPGCAAPCEEDSHDNTCPSQGLSLRVGTQDGEPLAAGTYEILMTGDGSSLWTCSIPSGTCEDMTSGISARLLEAGPTGFTFALFRRTQESWGGERVAGPAMMNVTVDLPDGTQIMQQLSPIYDLQWGESMCVVCEAASAALVLPASNAAGKSPG